MTSERIKEIQEQTAYPESVSVMLALKQVWNECEQEQLAIQRVSNRRELLFAYEKSFESENFSDADIYQTIDNFLANNCC